MSISGKIQYIYDLCRPNRYALKPYLVNDGKQHPFAVICPGGGYSAVCSFVEGKPFAKALNKLGYHAFVVYYRTKDKARYPNPQEDLNRAIEEILAHAEEWNLDKDGYSLWGSSAGGHLAASYCTENHKTAKPSALILVYPVITMGEYTHKGSRDMLLGQNPNRDMIKKLSVEENIDSNYPPTFVWYGNSDDTVAPLNSKMLAEALAKVSVTYKVEEYEGIGHGVGLAKNTAAEPWFKNAVRFWESQR